MSLLVPDSGLLFWMLVAFLVVFGVLAKFGWPVITQMVDARKQFIDESLDKARQAQDQLAQVQEQSMQLLKQAQEKQSQILAEAMAMRNQMVEKAKSDAQIEGQKLIVEARAQIEKEKEAAIRDIRRQVGLLSVEIAEQVLRQNLKEDKAQMGMINRMLDEMIEK